jgi:hypothetical protein
MWSSNKHPMAMKVTSVVRDTADAAAVGFKKLNHNL